MRTKTIDAILSVARLIERILEVRLPMAAASGLRICFEDDENVETVSAPGTKISEFQR
jgi:hypothetical protein